MWLEKGTKKSFLKLILRWIWLNSLGQLSNIAIDFLESAHIIRAGSCRGLMSRLFHKVKHDISRPGAIEIAHDDFVLRNLEIVGHLVDVV